MFQTWRRSDRDPVRPNPSQSEERSSQPHLHHQYPGLTSSLQFVWNLHFSFFAIQFFNSSNLQLLCSLFCFLFSASWNHRATSQQPCNQRQLKSSLNLWRFDSIPYPKLRAQLKAFSRCFFLSSPILCRLPPLAIAPLYLPASTSPLVLLHNNFRSLRAASPFPSPLKCSPIDLIPFQFPISDCVNAAKHILHCFPLQERRENLQEHAIYLMK